MCTGLEALGAGASLFGSLFGALTQKKGNDAPAQVAAPAAPAQAKSPVISAQRTANAADAATGPSSTDLTNGMLVPEMLKLGKGTLLGS